MKCLVTGATGFVGRHLCRALLARGDTLVALSRHGEPLEDGTATIPCHLATQAPDARLFDDVDVVFHLAGIAHQGASDADYEAVNHRATLQVAALAAAAGVGTFLFLSSVKAMGPPPDESARSELQLTPPDSPYGRSKLDAEQALLQSHSGGAMALLIIRPALVYGVGVKGNLQLLASGVHRGMPCPPAGGRRSMIAIDDLIGLLCHVSDIRGSVAHTWIACGAGSYSARTMVELMYQAYGRSAPRAWLPGWAWRSATTAKDLLSGDAIGTTYEKLFGTELYSNQRVVADTGWKPAVRLEDAVVEICQEVTQ